MLVYRIEHPADSLGPYQSYRESNDELQKWEHGPAIELHNAHSPCVSETHPVCTQIYGWKKGYVCGFSSMTKLKKWFAPKFRESMRQHGFVCCVFDVNPDAMCSDDYQVGFDREEAELLDTIEIPC